MTRTMKQLTSFLVLVVVVMLSGCSTITQPRVVEFSLVTTPKATMGKSSNAVKEDTGSAIAKQRAMIANDPNNGTLFGQLSYLLGANKQYDEAITAAQRAIELNPGVWFDALGYAYQGKGQYDNALKAYKKAIATDPKALTYSWLGITYMDMMDYPNAAQAFRRASELDAQNDDYLMKMATAYYRMGQYDSALSAIDKAINIKNNGMMGMRIKIEGVSKTNINIVGAVVDSAETSSRKIETDLNKWVIKACNVIEVEKDSPADKAGFKVGDELIAIDNISLLDPAVAKSSTDFFENYIKAKAPGTPVEVFRQGKNKGTTVILGRLNDPYLPLKLGIKANLLARISKNEEAVKCANEALDCKQANNMSDSWARIAIGKINLGNGRYAEAIKQFSSVENSPTVKVLEAVAYIKKGDADKAIDLYSAIPEKELSPKNVPLWSDRTTLLNAFKPFMASTMENAGTLKTQGKYKEALKELGDALKIADETMSEEILSEITEIISIAPKLSELPEEARKHALRGEILTGEGKFEDAAKECRLAVQAAPYIAQLYFNAAMIYGKSKGYTQAIRYMKTYLQLAPEAPNARAAKDQIYKWELLAENEEKKG